MDTGGAGDWTTAGFLLKSATRGTRIDGPGVADALRFGQALAALNCATPGARGLMRLTRRTILRRAKAVLEEGGLSGTLRLADAPKLRGRAGLCSMCLMPIADAELPFESDAISAVEVSH